MEEFKKVKRFVESFDDTYETYRDDLRVFYHEDGFTYKKYDPRRNEKQ